MNFSLIEDDSLSRGWAKSFLQALNIGRHEVSPFALNLTGFEDESPLEDLDLRGALNSALEESGHQLVHTVANTIFPQSLWDRCHGDRNRLYERYLESLPDYVSFAPNHNGKGLYFSRLIAWGIDPKTGTQEKHLPSARMAEKGNQLEYIISRCKKGARRAKFQAAVYDPVRDVHDGPYQKFPCLQQLTFEPDFKAGSLALNAFYATQQLFVKAYGNWLGLSRLGRFVGSQVGLRFSRLTCFTGILKMDSWRKSGDFFDRLRDLAEELASTATDKIGVG